MASKQESQSIYYLGRGYNPLYLDRNHLQDIEGEHQADSTGVKASSPFVLAKDAQTGVFLPVPASNTQTAPLHEGQVYEQINEVSSSYDFSSKVSLSVKVNAGVEGLFTASQSTEWTQLEKRFEQTDDTELLTTGQVRHEQWLLSLVSQSASGARQVLQLTDDFRQQLLAAVESATPATQDPQFLAFVKRYGTHFSEKVVRGGKFEQRISIKKHELTRLESTGVKVSVEASVTLKKITVGSEISTDTELSKEWKEFYKNSTREINTVGGRQSGATDESALKDWLASLDGPNYAVIEVALAPYWNLLTPDFFPSLDAGTLQTKQERLRTKILDYFEERGVNLGESRVRDGDVVYLAPMDTGSGQTDHSVQTPDMLYQGPGAFTVTSIGNIKGPSLAEFKQKCLQDGPDSQRYAPYLWRVARLDGGSAKDDIRPGQRFRLTNLATGKPLDSVAGNPATGLVSASPEVNVVLDPDRNPSDAWTMIPLRDQGTSPSVVLDAGAGLALARVYASVGDRNPKGCLYYRAIDKLARSTGSTQITKPEMLQTGSGFRVVKVNRPQTSATEKLIMSQSETRAAAPDDAELLRAEKCQFHIYLTNDTQFDWVSGSEVNTNYYIDYGKLMEGPHDIPAGSLDKLGFKAQGRANTATGSNGWVKWVVFKGTANETVLKANFDVPYSKKNTGSFEITGPYKDRFSIRQNGPNPTGDIAVMTLVIVGK